MTVKLTQAVTLARALIAEGTMPKTAANTAAKDFPGISGRAITAAMAGGSAPAAATYSSRKSAMTAAGRAGYKAADVTVIDHTTGFSWHPKAPGVSLANPTYDAFLGAVQDAITDDMRSDAVAETADRALYIAATYGPADAPDCGEFETDLTDDQEAQAEAIIAANHEAKRQAEDEARDADAIETRPMLQLADIAGGDYGMVLADEADAAAQKIANDTGKPIGICDARGFVLRAATRA
jgi:hypothetical protein